jgi:hypothetical protein
MRTARTERNMPGSTRCPWRPAAVGTLSERALGREGDNAQRTGAAIAGGASIWLWKRAPAPAGIEATIVAAVVATVEALPTSTPVPTPTPVPPPRVLNASASLRPDNLIIAEVQASLDREARVYVEYESPGAGREGEPHRISTGRDPVRLMLSGAFWD